MAVTSVNFETYSKIEIHDMAGNLIGRSEVQEEKDDSIHVSAPIGMDGMKILEVGQKVICAYYHDSKGYRFKTKVSNRFVDKLKIFVLQKPETYEIIQRRESVRVDHSVPLRYVPITQEEKDYIMGERIFDKVAIKTEFDVRFLQGRTYNISAGGLGIYTPNETMRVGDYLVVLIELDGREEMMIMQVVKVSRDDLTGGSHTRKVGAKLVRGERGLEERMFQYLFKVMREQSFVKSHE